jgi:hypothetical protein
LWGKTPTYCEEWAGGTKACEWRALFMSACKGGFSGADSKSAPDPFYSWFSLTRNPATHLDFSYAVVMRYFWKYQSVICLSSRRCFPSVYSFCLFYLSA